MSSSTTGQSGSGTASQSGNPFSKDHVDCVLPPNSTYHGMTYGDIAGMWTNWLMSENPDYSYPGDIAFLRGNLKGYKDKKSYYDRRDSRALDHSSTDVGNGMTIDTQTAVFVPVITTTFTREDLYEGIKLESDDGIRNAVRAYVRGGGPIFATIEENGKNARPLVDDLLEYKVTSPVFQLLVSDSNPFLNDLETPIKPDIHDAVTGGYFLLLKNLPKGVYRIRFGGKGLGNYFTDSIYDITVIAEGEQTVLDISKHKSAKSDLTNREAKAE